MAQKNTFTPEMIISMENIMEAIETVKLHIENARPHFEEIFQINNSKIQEASTGNQDRVACFTGNVLPKDTHWTEILYCVKVSLVKLQTQIFINKSHSQLNLLKEKTKEYDQEEKEVKLKFMDHPAGFMIYTDRKLYDLINDPEADDKIKQWFIDSFHSIAGFIKATPELKWSIQFKNKNIFDEYRNHLTGDGYSPSTIDLYVTLAEDVIRAGFKRKDLEFDPEKRDSENLKKMERMTFGDHGTSFKGKHSFRRFMNILIDEVENKNTEAVPS